MQKVEHLTNQITALSGHSVCLLFNISRFGRLVIDWSVENIHVTPNVTLYGISLYNQKMK